MPVHLLETIPKSDKADLALWGPIPLLAISKRGAQGGVRTGNLYQPRAQDPPFLPGPSLRVLGRQH